MRKTKNISFSNHEILALMIDWCAEAYPEREHFLISYPIAKLIEENLIHLAESKGIAVNRSDVFQENILSNILKHGLGEGLGRMKRQDTTYERHNEVCFSDLDQTLPLMRYGALTPLTKRNIEMFQMIFGYRTTSMRAFSK
ncbi:MAG: hypothetical protein ACPG5U_08565 [Planktomarina sp.]